MATALIVDAVRTATGRTTLSGALRRTGAAELLAVVLRTLSERHGIRAGEIDEIISGCPAAARAQADGAETWPGTPMRWVGPESGASAAALRAAAVMVIGGDRRAVIAGGAEAAGRHPEGGPGSSPGASGGTAGGAMRTEGILAELVCAQWRLSRERLDGFAAEAHTKAVVARAAAALDEEVAAVPVETAHGRGLHRSDELVRPGTTLRGLGRLPPLLSGSEGIGRHPWIRGNVTAGNSAPLAEGASAALIANESAVAELGLCPKGRVLAVARVDENPLALPSAAATRAALAEVGLDITDIGAYEVDELFASTTLAWKEAVGADGERLNVHGGSLAIGRPSSAAATCQLSTLLNVLTPHSGRFGLLVLRETSRTATAMVIERLRSGHRRRGAAGSRRKPTL